MKSKHILINITSIPSKHSVRHKMQTLTHDVHISIRTQYYNQKQAKRGATQKNIHTHTDKNDTTENHTETLRTI